ncbi:ribulokinase [Breznakiella homolactica]|uniref:Ribulokinase n=1 Tax=Breznakiella homolactica TaxID=2798577 RepID=A0A7T7XK88_9SPIR|nr:ribulokinase [Breznakiella homolactica]QQO07906.1 ribulokinase [Breznakiella homolactica]
MSKYAVGVDFGTLSARAILIDERGAQLAERVMDYPHGVLDKTLPGGTPLGPDWALQVPRDYIECLTAVVRGCMEESKVPAESVAGIGIDFTSCSVMPALSDGTPLCEVSNFRDVPHAYAKLWKHHAAQYCADILNETAAARAESWLPMYGGKISSEWLIPKAMQIVKEAPDVYGAMDRFIECGDWVVWQLCGKEIRSACNAGYKAQWRYGEGYPSKEFFKALDPRMENFTGEKLSPDIRPLGSRAGFLTPEMAAAMGLTVNTAVAVGVIDAHASVPACGIASPGKMLMAMGTSTCHLLLSEDEKPAAGVCGVVKDGIIPGLFAYEAGQSCVGDHFSWFVENCVPESYALEAKAAGISLHQLLRRKAEGQKPGGHGLVALDWWNGVRSTLMDFDLSGVIAGMTLQTKPEDVYRALIEATAYGTRNIIGAFRSGGVPVDELYAGGGIARKDPMTMQIYADVTGCDIKIASSAQNAAVGAAIYGFAAGMPEKNIAGIVRDIGAVGDVVYHPNPEHTETYSRLFALYMELHDFFGREEPTILHRLKAIRTGQG